MAKIHSFANFKFVPPRITPLELDEDQQEVLYSMDKTEDGEAKEPIEDEQKEFEKTVVKLFKHEFKELLAGEKEADIDQLKDSIKNLLKHEIKELDGGKKEKGVNLEALKKAKEWADKNWSKDDKIEEAQQTPEAKTALEKLYNGIKNDYSIQKYSLGWSDVTEAIEKELKGKITKDEKQSFENYLVADAVKVATGKVKELIEAFARELSINMETLRDKSKGDKSIHRG